MAEKYSIICMHHILFIYPSGGGHTFPPLFTMSNATISMHLQTFVRVPAFNSYIPKSGITGSCNNSMLNFLRNCLFSTGAASFTFLPVERFGDSSDSER